MAWEAFCLRRSSSSLQSADIMSLLMPSLFRWGFRVRARCVPRLVEFAPERVVAAILSSPGHYEPMGMNTVHLDRDALGVPQLIVAGGHDEVSGTARPYTYFHSYRELGAPWLSRCKTILRIVAQQMRRA